MVPDIPHQTKIARKWKGVGAQLRTIACGETGIRLRIDIMEGKVALQDNKKSGAGTAVTLRLASPWFASGRIAIGDSAFASFWTLMALLLVGGVFMSVVRTALKLFPAKWCKQWFDERMIGNRERGRWQTLTASDTRPDGVADYPMMTVVFQDKKCKNIICNDKKKL
jgi:hypothetical protein